MFCCDISLTDEEFKSLEPLTWLAFTQMILWHDYSSWDKEAATYHDREEGGSNMSAVQVYMTMHGLNQQSAKDHLRDEIARLENEYCERKQRFVLQHAPADHVMHYIGLVELCSKRRRLSMPTFPFR